VGTPRKG